MTYELLKEVVRGLLAGATSGAVYYEDAPNTAEYPYTVFDFDRDDTRDFFRDDVRLNVDVWDRGTNPITVEAIGDQIDAALNYLNYPSGVLLPTFFREVRYSMPDKDKALKRHHMEYTIQTYEKEH